MSVSQSRDHKCYKHGNNRTDIPGSALEIEDVLFSSLIFPNFLGKWEKTRGTPRNGK